MSYRDETEPTYLPHVERALRPLTVVNGTQQTTWFPRRMDLPPLENQDAADEGGTFRESAPARVPRADRMTVNWWPLIGLLAVIFGAPLCVWLIATLWGAN